MERQWKEKSRINGSTMIGHFKMSASQINIQNRFDDTRKLKEKLENEIN